VQASKFDDARLKYSLRPLWLMFAHEASEQRKRSKREGGKERNAAANENLINPPGGVYDFRLIALRTSEFYDCAADHPSGRFYF